MPPKKLKPVPLINIGCGEATKQVLPVILIPLYSKTTLFQDLFVKMTIISTHRNHTYKARSYKRSISPNKISSQKITLNKNYSQKLFDNNNNTMLKSEIIDPTQIVTTLMALLRNYVSNIDTSDVIEDYCDETMTDDEYEDMWAHYDYLEALYD